MITDRDLEIISWIDTVGVADSGHIQRMFFRWDEKGREIKNKRVVCNRILKKLVEIDELKNDKKQRENINKKLIYYKTKPKQLTHNLLITEFIVRLHEYGKGTVLNYYVQRKIDEIIPDIIVRYEKMNGFRELIQHYLFVEVHLSNNPISSVVGKYEEYFASGKWKDKFPVFPKIIILSTKKMSVSSQLNIRQINFKLKDMEKISDKDMDMIFG